MRDGLDKAVRGEPRAGRWLIIPYAHRVFRPSAPPSMDLVPKLSILADAAKYDASCASSGARGRTSTAARPASGSTTGMGICHSYAPDGRCISLLKILLTNFCLYDCQLLRQPALERRPARALHGRRGRHAHARLLPAQLHRGTVPVVGHHPIPGLHDGAAGARGADAARGARLPRLHPSEDDPRRRRASHRRGRRATPTASRSTSSCPPAKASPRSRRRRTCTRSSWRWAASARAATRRRPSRGRRASRPPARARR